MIVTSLGHKSASTNFPASSVVVRKSFSIRTLAATIGSCVDASTT